MPTHFPLEFPDHRHPPLSWQAREVVRKLDDRPHLLMRIQIQGGTFLHLDASPFVRIVGRRGAKESWFAEVADDGTSISGYFPVNARPNGIIEYGYGSRVVARIPGPFEQAKAKRLVRSRLPDDLVVVTEQFVRRKQAGRLPPEIRMPEPRRRRRG